MSPQAPECTRTHELLLDYAYGELSGASKREVDEHLPGCADCRAELAALTSTRRVMASLAPEPAPATGLDSLLAYAEQQARRQRPAPKRARWLTWLLAGVPVAAVVLVGVNVAIMHHAPSAEVQESAGPPNVAVLANSPVTVAEAPKGSVDVPARADVEVAKSEARPVVAPMPMAKIVGHGAGHAVKDAAEFGARPDTIEAGIGADKKPEPLTSPLLEPPRGASRAAAASGAAAADGARDGFASNLGGAVDYKKSKSERVSGPAASQKEELNFADDERTVRDQSPPPPALAAQTFKAGKKSDVAAPAKAPQMQAAAPNAAPATVSAPVVTMDEVARPVAGEATGNAQSSAEDLRRGGRHAAAADSFLATYESNPTGPGAAEALYSAGLEARAANQLARAAEIFERYANEFPSGSRAATALASAAEIRRSQDGEGAATTLEQNLLHRYPGSPEAQSLNSRSRTRREASRPSAEKSNKTMNFDSEQASPAPNVDAPARAAETR